MESPRTLDILNSLISQAENGNAPKVFHTPERYQILGMLFNCLRYDIAQALGKEKLMNSPEGERIRASANLLEMGMVPKEFQAYFNAGKKAFLADVEDIAAGKMQL